MKKIIILLLAIQFYYSQDKGLSSFEEKDYKKSHDYYLNVLKTRKNDIPAKFGAGISAFKNQEIETGIKYLQEVSTSSDEILASRAHFNLANIYKDENKLEESIHHYRKAIELNSKDREAKINYELLKRMLKQEDQESQSNQGEEGDEEQEGQESESNQGEEGDEEQEGQESQSNQGEQGDDEQEGQESQSNQGEEGDEEQEQEIKEGQGNQSEANNNGSGSKELSDKEIQAEAILNALKNQEKINQKQKL